MGTALEYDLAPGFEMNDIDKGGGLIGIGTKVSDYILGADILTDLGDEKSIDYQVKYEYNQGAEYETRNYCTLFSAFTMLSHLKDKSFSVEDIKCVANKMILDGKLDPDLGAYLSDAIDYVRRWWNARNEDKISSYQVDLTDTELLKKIDDKNLMLQFGYRTSSELYNDAQDDGNVVGTDFPKRGGHAVSRWGEVWWTIDNYLGQKSRNRYSFENPQELINNGVIFREGYIFLNA